LVAIADINEPLGRDIAKQFSTKYYYDYKELIANEKPDIVSICTRTKVHYEIAKYCIENHINILLEKPITNDIQQAEELLELAKKNNISLLIGHIERFNPAVKKVKEIVDN
jgi:UDP-N-acetylglucosamine 3-dehydrogenase